MKKLFQSAMRAIRYGGYDCGWTGAIFFLFQSAMRAIRYGDRKWFFIQMSSGKFQSAMRAIRYGVNKSRSEYITSLVSIRYACN